MPKIILIDQDGVLADFEAYFLKKWIEKYPVKPYIQLKDRKTQYIIEQYPKDFKEEIESIYHAPGFYLNLPPIIGAIQALDEMLELGYDVRICTSPLLPNYKNCVLEKFDWVLKHLGEEWVKRIILTHDKSLIIGDVLVDDFYLLKTSREQCWEHILFSTPYNINIKDKKRIDGWSSSWRSVLGIP